MSASKNILIEGALFASTINNYERFTNLYHLIREQWGIEPFGRERNKAHDCLLVEITVTFFAEMPNGIRKQGRLQSFHVCLVHTIHSLFLVNYHRYCSDSK